jgi:hypothetical protein
MTAIVWLLPSGRLPGGWSQTHAHPQLTVRNFKYRTEYDRHLESLGWLLGSFGEAPLPSLETLLSRPMSALEIGCGEALALLEVLHTMENHTFGGMSTWSGHTSCSSRDVSHRRSACAAGLNAYAYALRKNFKGDETAAAAARARGSIVAGNVSRAALHQMARRHRVPMPSATPHIKHGDFTKGLPFGNAAFDLIYSQNAIPKMPDPKHNLAGLLDEVLRTMNVEGSAILMIAGVDNGLYNLVPPFVQQTPIAKVQQASNNSLVNVPFLTSHPKLVFNMVTGLRPSPIKGLSKGHVPLELVVGTVTTRTSPCTSDGCACAEPNSDYLSPHSASVGRCRRCALAYLYSTVQLELPDVEHLRHGGVGYLGLYLHHFDVTDTEQPDACLRGAQHSQLVGRTLSIFADGNFEMRREDGNTTDRVISALGTQWDKADAFMTAARRWFRNASTWSDIYVLGPSSAV